MNSLKLFARRTSAAFYNPTSSFSPHYRSLSSSVSAHPNNNNNKLFVAGLSWSVDERSLLDAFSNFGEVTEVRIMYDKVTGRSRGFGFVYFAKDDFAASAKDAMDGKELLGRPMRISFAVDRVRGDPTMVSRIRDSEAAIRYKN